MPNRPYRHLSILPSILPSILLALIMLPGCTALETAIVRRDLDVQTQMSNTIFLTPVTPDKKTIYISIKNTSSENRLKLSPIIAKIISKNGYRIINDPQRAHYWLQANLLYVGRENLAIKKALDHGFGTALAAGGLGVSAALIAKGDAGTAAAAGIAAGLAGWVADRVVEDVVFAVLMDILISEKTTDSVTIDQSVEIPQGASGQIKQKTKAKGARLKYTTRILTTARQVNLEFDEAVPTITQNLAQSISGVF